MINRPRLFIGEGVVRGDASVVAADGSRHFAAQQIAAAQEALRGAGKLMVRSYMEKCATEGIKAGRAKEVYDEFLEIIYRMVR
ncbi:MAG TPA: metal-sensing transcriptional repressor [Thermoanaerobaculia bacterium]|nr:metal-sensing transcriptional repressor [Thermoanaerobaculia bacterium]